MKINQKKVGGVITDSVANVKTREGGPVELHTGSRFQPFLKQNPPKVKFKHLTATIENYILKSTFFLDYLFDDDSDRIEEELQHVLEDLTEEGD